MVLEIKKKKEKGCGEIVWCRGSIAGKEARVDY